MLGEVDLEPRKLNDEQISPLDLNFRSPNLPDDLEAENTIREPSHNNVSRKKPRLPRLNTDLPPGTVTNKSKQRPVPIVGPSPASSFSSHANDSFPTDGDLSDIESIRQRLAAVLGHGSQSSLGSVSGQDTDVDSEDIGGGAVDDDDGGITVEF